MSTQICSAPFTGILIDTDKSIKPCCAYGDQQPFGRPRARATTLQNNNDFGVMSDSYRLKDIIESKQRKRIQDITRKNKIPIGCRTCDRSYQRTGRSQKMNWVSLPEDGGRLYPGWQDNITSLELNNSNTCNLSCAPCNSFFSSSWLKYEEMLPSDLIRHQKRPPTTSFDIVSHLKEIDLTHLKVLTIKGGEPFMNPELLPVLQHLLEINVLQDLIIKLVTNGTILGKEIKGIKLLLEKAKRIIITISVDGVGDVGTYIRYSPQQFAKVENIEKFLITFEDQRNVKFHLFPTIQVYNIFSLDKIVEWWGTMVNKYENVYDSIQLNHFVFQPNYLSVSVLRPHIIEKIIQYYKNKDDQRYEKLITSLCKITYLGNQVHNEMVKYTLEMDKIKGQNVFESIPELADEMILR